MFTQLSEVFGFFNFERNADTPPLESLSLHYTFSHVCDLFMHIITKTHVYVKLIDFYLSWLIRSCLLFTIMPYNSIHLELFLKELSARVFSFFHEWWQHKILLSNNNNHQILFFPVWTLRSPENQQIVGGNAINEYSNVTTNCHCISP